MALDRTGEPVDPEPTPHDPRCVSGWIDRDGEHPKPCLDCKPHLAPAELRRKAFGPYDPGPRPDDAAAPQHPGDEQ